MIDSGRGQDSLAEGLGVKFKSSINMRWVTGLTWYLLLKPCSFLATWEISATHRQNSRGERASPWNIPLHWELLHSPSGVHFQIWLPERYQISDQISDRPSHIRRRPGCLDCPQPFVGNHVICLPEVNPCYRQGSPFFNFASFTTTASITRASRHPLVPRFKAFCSSGSRPFFVTCSSSISVIIAVSNLYEVLRHVIGL